MSYPFPIYKHLIMLGIVGSHAYGTSIPSSDIDWRGICTCPKEYLFGFQKRFEQYQPSGVDTVIYDIRKFLKLCSDGNPSMVDILFLPEDCILYQDENFQLIRNSRQLFISLELKAKFMGYAIAQLRRIETHRKWLLNPPKKQPTLEDFGFQDLTQYRENCKLIKTLAEAGQQNSNIFIDLNRKIRDYHQAIKYYDQYNTWKTQRNPERKLVEEKYGYDTKHASHLVRLIRIIEELITTGEFNVRRPDAWELLAIKTNGIWTYEELINWANEKENTINALFENNKIGLPNHPNRNRIDELCIEIIERKLYETSSTK